MSETETTTAVEVAQPQQAGLTMWNDKASLDRAWRAAGMLSRSELVPDTYRGKPENCLIALDIAGRINWSPMAVMQSLYIVKGKPSWSGQACIAMINGCGRFTPLSFRWQGERGQNDWGCVALATRLHDRGCVESAPAHMAVGSR